LRAAYTLNGLDDRITCVGAAISASIGEVEMVTQDSGRMSEVKAEGARQGFGEPGQDSGLVRVPAITLDELARAHKVALEEVAFIWSDTQGYERQMIESGASLWAAGVPVFLELWRNGLRVHGGVDAFVATAERHFASLVSRRDLMKRGAAAPLRPISELESLVEGAGDGHTDALPVPR
jgi:FkbM family methyltransferase